MFPVIAEVWLPVFVIPVFDRITKLFVPTDRRLTGAGPRPPAPPVPWPAPGFVGATAGPAGLALSPPPPHPATKAASTSAINHVRGLEKLPNLFMCFSCNGIPKGIGVRLLHRGRESPHPAPGIWRRASLRQLSPTVTRRSVRYRTDPGRKKAVSRRHSCSAFTTNLESPHRRPSTTRSWPARRFVHPPRPAPGCCVCVRTYGLTFPLYSCRHLVF